MKRVNATADQLTSRSATKKPNITAERLRKLRRDEKLTQMEVAAGCGIDRSTLAKIESGDDQAGRGALEKLSKFYGVSLDWLAGGNGPMMVEEAMAKNDRERQFLAAIRQLPEDEAQAHLELLQRRLNPKN